MDEIEIPTVGVKQSKIEEFKDLILRYIQDNDRYNNKAVHDGVMPAMAAIGRGAGLKEILAAIDGGISGFQLNWVMNTLAEFSTKSAEIKNVWEKYQKSLEPKKKSARRSKESAVALDE